MTLGNTGRMLTKLLAALALTVAVPHVALAQETAAANVADQATPAAEAAEGSTAEAAPGPEAPAYEPLGPEWIKGQPVDGELGFQPQYSPDGEFAIKMHDYLLLPVITVISLLVLILLLLVIVRYNRRANPVPSKTSHNTLIEVIWTVVPAIILLVIAVPSIKLLARQYEAPPEDALTVKVTGYQWYWGYSFPDNGGFEVISNMLDEEEARRRGEPPQLAADNRLVLPVGEWIRVQTTGADVIHAFAVPSLWFKIDAVPGRLNERKMFINEPGIYYGQCSELCGARHGYMPIAIEAVPRAQFEQWVLSQGGTLGAAEEAAPAAAPLQQPESAVPEAPGAGAPPTASTASAAPAA
jgi:cytochrome c oxidase subunit 2